MHIKNVEILVIIFLKNNGFPPIVRKINKYFKKVKPQNNK